MKKHTPDTDEPMEIGERVYGLIPPPEFLVRKEENTKITLELTPLSIVFFKQQAKKLGVPYTKIIRSVLNSYAEVHHTPEQTS